MGWNFHEALSGPSRCSMKIDVDDIPHCSAADIDVAMLSSY